MGSVVREATKHPWETVLSGGLYPVFKSTGMNSILEEPELPALPPLPAAPETKVDQPPAPEVNKESSQAAQAERSRLLAAAKRRTRTLLTGPAGLAETANTMKKTLLGQ